METLDIWSDIHPPVLTVPMNWDYKMPYGMIYSKHPSDSMKDFIVEIQKRRSPYIWPL